MLMKINALASASDLKTSPPTDKEPPYLIGKDAVSRMLARVRGPNMAGWGVLHPPPWTFDPKKLEFFAKRSEKSWGFY